MNTKKDINNKIDEIFTRGVPHFFDPKGKIREKIYSKAVGEYTSEVVVKFGMDPTRPDIHLGHAVILRKLRSLQDLGCKVVFLVGDLTAQIGDPTGKSKTRPDIEQKEVEKNMQTYLDQAGKILRTDKKTFTWIRNSEWFYNVTDVAPSSEVNMNIKKDGKESKISLKPGSFLGKAAYFESTRMQKTHLKKKQVVGVSLRTLLSTLQKITHSQLIDRDMFQDRLETGQELFMHEMLYPVLQGIDSVMIERIYGSCDLEVGGTDQTFNMLLGRDIMKMNKMDPQAVASFELLRGTDGKEKMSKSLDNYIGITDEPSNMYGKIMSLPDESIIEYFELCTYSPMMSIDEIKKQFKKGVNPRDIKMRLAGEVVSIYHGEEMKERAKKEFVDTFQKNKIPERIPKVMVKKESSLMDTLVKNNTVASNMEFRRLVENGAVTDMEKGKIEKVEYKIKKDIIIKVGKKRFLKIIVKK